MDIVIELIDEAKSNNDSEKVNDLALSIQMHVEELDDFYNSHESGNSKNCN